MSADSSDKYNAEYFKADAERLVDSIQSIEIGYYEAIAIASQKKADELRNSPLVSYWAFGNRSVTACYSIDKYDIAKAAFIKWMAEDSHLGWQEFSGQIYKWTPDVDKVPSCFVE